MFVYCSFAVAATLATLSLGTAQPAIPYRSPYQCPSPKVPTNNCSTCAQDELCCDSVCAVAVLPPKPCDAVVSKPSPSLIVGAYVPQCSDDGNFNPVQRWASTGSSWCVDTSNGKPLSAAAAPRGQQPNCTVCEVNGKTYYPGQSFAASDGCNTCSCLSTGVAVCTLMACNVGFTIPYRSPYQCPSPQVSTDNCSTCAEDELCCDSECTTGVLPQRPCDVVSKASSSLIGAYVPQCSPDGNFNPVQTHGSTGYSWCVNTADGKPLSEVASPRGQKPSCTVCEVSGKVYYPGQSFPAADSCNTCFCSNNGLAACTKKACIACSVRGQVFTECGSACNATCDKPVSFCVLSCVPKCECPSGQVVDTTNNKCVEQLDCPQPAITIPYRSPYTCPSPKLLTRNCSTCAEDELCCNSICTKAVLPPRPCSVAVANSYPSQIGAYVPQCSDDGNFNPVQRWASTGSSWCVDTLNGKALSEAVPRGQQPNCITCTMGGKTYYPGQSFTASDGCNTCSCSVKGTAVCTVKDCQLGFTIPYRSPYQCPSSQVSTGNCSTCAEDKLCCDSKCTTGVLPQRPCDVVSKASSLLIGAYVPQCSPDGNFNPVQIHGSTGYSWCVNTADGKPLSKVASPRGQKPNCAVCEVSGKVYYPGQSFPAADSCNTCFCSNNGLAACTKKACIAACSVRGQVFTECGSACDATCDKPVSFCVLSCVPKCQCPSGQVVDTANNKCVKQLDCPQPVTVAPAAPYISPYQCPAQMRLTKDNCSSCLGDELCCNSTCTKGVLPAKPCTVAALQSPRLPGAYMPQCRSDGTFAPIQFRASTGYSWCVDISNGKPLSVPVGPGRRPNCTVCAVSGKTYYPGQSFVDSDGCNTCSCSQTGASVCTQRACIVCSAKGQTYTACGSPCEATCTNPAPICATRCVAKCQCPPGTVLDKSNNKCVSRNSCPRRGGA